LKEEALDRTLWRTRFGRGYGHIVRQAAEWRGYGPVVRQTAEWRGYGPVVRQTREWINIYERTTTVRRSSDQPSLYTHPDKSAWLYDKQTNLCHSPTLTDWFHSAELQSSGRRTAGTAGFVLGDEGRQLICGLWNITG
jgi:hypothetical protein